MANLDLIKWYEQRYRTPVVEVIKKAFNPSVTDDDPLFQQYLEQGKTVSAGLLFIDVCNFSTRLGDMPVDNISRYFDGYYETVMPIIYSYGGVVDKIMGDGIIAVFGAPFLNISYSGCLHMAFECAKEIINETADTLYSTKVAYNAGKINYFKNKSGFYEEYTMIGKPLTELFRLESVSEDEAINYFGDSIASAYINSLENVYGDLPETSGFWIYDKKSIPPLKGLTYSETYYIKHCK